MSDRRVQGEGYSAARDRRIGGVAVTGVAGGHESDMPPSEPAGARRADPLEPAHGHALDAADHRLLRGRPPAAALRWCATAAGGSGRPSRTVEALAGGTSSAVHAVQVRDGRDRVHALVLRRFVRADWLPRNPISRGTRRPARARAVLPRLHAVAVTGPASAAIPDYTPYGSGTPARRHGRGALRSGNGRSRPLRAWPRRPSRAA